MVSAHNFNENQVPLHLINFQNPQIFLSSFYKKLQSRRLLSKESSKIFRVLKSSLNRIPWLIYVYSPSCNIHHQRPRLLISWLSSFPISHSIYRIFFFRSLIDTRKREVHWSKKFSRQPGITELVTSGKVCQLDSSP